MDTRGFIAQKKVVGKYQPVNQRKKFTAPTFVEKNKQRNFRQFQQEDQSLGMKKPFRMNSVNKPTRGIAGQVNYGINGVNYLKKKGFEHFANEVEEIKSSSNYPSYAQNFNNQLGSRMQERNRDNSESDIDYEAHIQTLTQKVEELESRLKSRDIEINRVKLQNQRLMNEK